MSLATYVTYVLPVVVLAIGAGTLLLNTALRHRRVRRPHTPGLHETASRPPARTVIE